MSSWYRLHSEYHTGKLSFTRIFSSNCSEARITQWLYSVRLFRTGNVNFCPRIYSNNDVFRFPWPDLELNLS